MASDPSIEDSREVLDERVVRTFLEHAAPIILESRTLDDERFDAVLALADQFGISREQLSCELRLLEQRGVISSAPWERLEPTESETDPVPDEEGTTPRSIPGAPSPQEVDRPPPAPTSPDAVELPPEIQVGPPPRKGDKPRRRSRRRQSKLDRFKQRAAQRIGARKTVSPRLRGRLLAQAARLGLSPEQAQAVLVSLSNQQAPGAPPVAPTTAKASKPKPSGKPKSGPKSTPSESFRRWVKQKLVGYPSAVLAKDDERGLVGVGVHRYHLARVLATHIVRDTATERAMRLERDLQDASCHSTVGTSGQASEDDVKLRAFFDQVAPILTQHRGINAQSRVMMNAIAEQLGLSQTELEQAVAALQQVRGDPDENDPRQIERRDSFRRYLRRAIAQLPNGIVTFKIERRLGEAGEHFHGVAPQWIKPTINEVASEVGARFISETQAREHVAALVDGVLAENSTVNGTTRSRIYAEGTRWGLDPMDVEAILEQQTEQKRQRVASERQRTRWVLRFAGAGATIAVMVLLWMVIPWPSFESPASSNGSATAPKKNPDAKIRPRTPWWDEDLQIAAINVRITRPDLKGPIKNLQSPLVSARTTAYQQIVEGTFGMLGDRQQQDDMRHLCVKLFAQDPSDTAARQLRESLLKIPLALDDKLPPDPDAVVAAFWGCRTAASMLADPELAVERAAELAASLEAATHQAPDRLLKEKLLQRQCLAALARRFYVAFTRAAAKHPEQVGKLFAALAIEAANYLDDATRDQLDAQFLAAILPAVDDQWLEYESTIRKTMRAAEAPVVIQMLHIYQSASNTDLKGYLAGLFLERLGAASNTLTEPEMIDALRKSLGVASKEEDNRRWVDVMRESTEILNRRHVDNTNPDVLLQETIDLAHLATLACALTRGDLGLATFDALRKKGPARLDIDTGPWSTKPSSPFKASYPVSSPTLVQQYVASLAKARTAPQKSQLLRMITNQSASTPDVDPATGVELAKYLMKFKPNDEEHRQMMLHAAKLARWNSVRLGLADQLAEMKGRDTQRQELFREILGKEVDLESEAGVAGLRRTLLTHVLSELSESSETDDERLRAFDQGSAALVEVYAHQARLLGVPLDKADSIGQPSTVINALIGHLAGQLGVAKLAAADRGPLEELPYRLQAADYVAVSDLQYTAMLQQIWVRLLAIQVIQARPDQAGAAREITARLQQPMPAQQRVYEQLRDLQSELLRLWLLLRPESVDIELESTAL